MPSAPAPSWIAGRNDTEKKEKKTELLLISAAGLSYIRQFNPSCVSANAFYHRDSFGRLYEEIGTAQMEGSRSKGDAINGVHRDTGGNQRKSGLGPAIDTRLKRRLRNSPLPR